MKDAATLLALAERVEALTEPDREVDAEIACALRIGPNLPDWALRWDGDWTPTIAGHAVLRHLDDSPGPSFKSREYTASLDAAMTLVPEGRDWMLDNFDGPHDRRCSSSVFNRPGALYEDFEAFAATPALALTAAALRAHAAIAGEG